MVHLPKHCPERLYHRVKTVHAPLHLIYYTTYAMEGGYAKIGMAIGFILITLFEIWHEGKSE